MDCSKATALVSIVLLGACAAVAQVGDVQAAAAAAVVAEVVPPEAFLPTAATAATGALADAAVAQVPTAMLRRNSPAQAKRALRNATMAVLKTADPPSDFIQQVVCGANSLTPTDFNVHCRIVGTYPSGVTYSCSAAKVGNNRLSTAGHCVYSKPQGGWARAIDVYCTGQQTCAVSRTTTATHLVTTNRWTTSSTVQPNAWDVAVIRTAGALPGIALPVAQYGNAGTARARLTGYPGSNTAAAGCSGYNACAQYSSTDDMQVTASGMYTSNKMDLCSGHSGGAVVDAGANVLVAVVSGEATSNGQCLINMFAPSVADSAVNEQGCTRSTGGASIACLSRALPA